MQAAGMVRCGLDADGKLLALAAASHSGEDFHIAGVHEILARAGLGTGALRCPPALPMDEGAQQVLLRLGGAAGAGVDSAALERIAAVPVVGGDRVVGEVRVRIPF
jgi:L-asparaginase II